MIAGCRTARTWMAWERKRDRADMRCGYLNGKNRGGPRTPNHWSSRVISSLPTMFSLFLDMGDNNSHCYIEWVKINQAVRFFLWKYRIRMLNVLYTYMYTQIYIITIYNKSNNNKCIVELNVVNMGSQGDEQRRLCRCRDDWSRCLASCIRVFEGDLIFYRTADWCHKRSRILLKAVSNEGSMYLADYVRFLFELLDFQR